MKKALGRLLVFSIGATMLAGCSLFDLEGEVKKDAADADREAQGLNLRDYRTQALKGSTYEFSGKAILYFEDGEEVDVTDECVYPTLDTSKVSSQEYKVKYEGARFIYSKTIKIEVVDSIDLKSIAIEDFTDTVKAKETYVFDGKVTATYTDGSKKDVTDLAEFSPVDTSKGNVSVDLVVSYTEDNVYKTALAKINVIREVVSVDISVTQSIFEVNKYTQSSVKPSLFVTYSDDSREEIKNFAGFDYSEIDGETPGEYALRATYVEDGHEHEATATITITEHVPVLQKIEASGYSTEVEKGTAYSFDGVVKATYDTGAVVDVTTACTFGTVSTSSTGNKTLTISYKDPNKGTTKSISLTIKVIAHVSGISITTPSLDIGKGRTKQINASVTPSDATNKVLNYSSNDTSIATVSSSGLVSAVGIGKTTITVSSAENSSINRTVKVTVNEAVQDEWTILIYMCGSNLESEGGYATKDIDEILKVGNQPSDHHIVIQTGGSTSWKKYSISSAYNQRYHVRNKSLVKDVDKVYSSYQGMGKASTLKDFIVWAIETYPSEKMGLILWNHGGGLGGVCSDDKAGGDTLTNNEVLSATRDAFEATGTSKFEFIGYDACLMQMMEVADFNSPYYNYQVASQESEAGDGWDYDTWVDDLYARKSSPEVFKAIVDGFIADNGGVSAYNGDQTLSYLDLSKMDAFKSAWEEMASATKNKITSSNKSDFQDDVIGATKYFSYQDYGYDAYNFLEKLQANSTFNPGGSYVENAKEALEALVGYNLVQTSGSADAHGVSCYMGDDSYNTSTYTHFTNWSSLIDYVGGYPSGGGWWW